VFARAVETDKLELWSDMLELLAMVVRDPALPALIDSPKLDLAQMTELMLDIGGARLSEEGQNLVRLLTANRRLSVLPEIATLFEARKAEQEGSIDVRIAAAYELMPDQEQQLAAALKRKLGREIKITSEKSPDLIGGFRLRAGDMVIDGSVSGQLGKLANELGI
jgi:F-type H+-transporting ATPase subunit delta